MEEENFEKILQMMQMMKMFGETEQEKVQEESQIIKEEEKSKLKNPIEDRVETSEIKMLKSAIPYLQYEHRRNFEIFVKFIEIQKIIEYYNNRVEISAADTAKDWRKGMLSAMRPHLEKEKRTMVDTLIKFMDMKEIIDTIKGEENNEY